MLQLPDELWRMILRINKRLHFEAQMARILARTTMIWDRGNTHITITNGRHVLSVWGYNRSRVGNIYYYWEISGMQKKMDLDGFFASKATWREYRERGRPGFLQARWQENGPTVWTNLDLWY